MRRVTAASAGGRRAQRGVEPRIGGWLWGAWEAGWSGDGSLVVRGSPFTCTLDRGKLSSFERRSRSNRQNRALIQCRASVGGAPSNLRIVSGVIPSLLAISSAVGSRPITCRMFRQVRTILFKASMVETDKWPSIMIPLSLPQIWPDPRNQQASALAVGCAR
jgi:hypothetical protein